MNHKSIGNGQYAEPQDSASDHEGDGLPILERSESFRWPSILKRTVAMLALESGISEEIASDPGATKQALVVFAIAVLVAGGLPDSLELLPVAVLAPLLGILPLSVSMVLYRLVAREGCATLPELVPGAAKRLSAARARSDSPDRPCHGHPLRDCAGHSRDSRPGTHLDVASGGNLADR